VSGADDTPGGEARALIRRCDRATLATLHPDSDGWPYGSLVLTACAHDSSPILLISDLAEHTQAIAADDRVSLLFDNVAGLDDPLTGARVTVMGTARRSADPADRARYLARHPSAAGYADFADFNFYRVAVIRAHLVAGFGEIHWIGSDALLFDTQGSAALGEAEADIVAHMNRDHADAIDLYARNLLGLDGDGWRLTGVDPEGADLRLGGRVARVGFDKPVADAEGARAELVRLVKRARARNEA